MKIIVIALAALMLTAGANAQASKSAKPTQADLLSLCKEIELLAEAVMTIRQNGVPLSAAQEKLSQLSLTEKAVASMAQDMLIEAYDTPRYSTPSIREETVLDFKNEWMLGCVKSVTGRE